MSRNAKEKGKIIITCLATALVLGLAFHAQAGAVTLPTTATWTVSGMQLNESCGYVIESAGDVNGDGYKDVIITCPGYNNGTTCTGKVMVFYGSRSGLKSAPDWVAIGENQPSSFGGRAAGAGDVNGDGFSDIIVGAPNYSNGVARIGCAYVYYGSAAGLSTSPSCILTGTQDGGAFGNVARAGDVNHDGYSDVIVGAPADGASKAGRVYVYHGGASGLSTTPNWTVTGALAGVRLGYVVGGVGDVNGDGYGDVAVVAQGANDFPNDSETLYVYQGSATGLSPTAAWSANVGSGGDFGNNVIGADLNSDGFSDIIASGRLLNATGKNWCGKIFVWYGSASGLGANGTASNCDWLAIGEHVGSYLGEQVAAGDFNGDGVKDFVTGAFNHANLVPNKGAGYIWLGSASGMGATGDVTNAAWKTYADQGESWYGTGVAAADINGDETDEVIISALKFSANGTTSTGRVYVYGNFAPPQAESLEIVSVTQTPEKNVEIIYNLTPADPAPANGYDISTLALATAQDCAATSGTPDSAFDDITSYVAGDTHITSGSGLLTWNIKGMPAGALKSKYWKAGVSVLFRLKATPKN